jgi:hypothetical protein
LFFWSIIAIILDRVYIVIAIIGNYTRARGEHYNNDIMFPYFDSFFFNRSIRIEYLSVSSSDGGRLIFNNAVSPIVIFYTDIIYYSIVDDGIKSALYNREKASSRTYIILCLYNLCMRNLAVDCYSKHGV